jgi:hypothetical protein
MCGAVGWYIVFVTVCEQTGDGCTECLRHVTVQHGSNWQIIVAHMILWIIITLFQSNTLTCSSDLKFYKLGMGNSCEWGGGSQSIAVLSRTVELLWWTEKNVKLSGFKLVAIKRNTHNDHGNKKNKVVSLETACFVPSLKRAQHISLGCALSEFYFSFLKGNIQWSQSVMKHITVVHQTNYRNWTSMDIS